MQTLFHEQRQGQPLPAGADLHAAMARQLETMAADGWEAETDYRWGVTFVRRGAERLEVGVRSRPPDAPVFGRALFSTR